jgi:hypothetical protein
MNTTILVPLDGSSDARAALPYGEGMARAGGRAFRSVCSGADGAAQPAGASVMPRDTVTATNEQGVCGPPPGGSVTGCLRRSASKSAAADVGRAMIAMSARRGVLTACSSAIADR